MEGAREITWHDEVLPTRTRAALRELIDATWLQEEGWYLAGGTALGLWVGHRQSQDLDFFIPKKTFLPDALSVRLEGHDWETDIIEPGTVYGRLCGAKVSFIAYPFFTSRADRGHYGVVPVLAPEDIAVMKIIAISQRGTKRDFVDLYWYLTNRERLIDILGRLHDQYPNISHNYHHIVKSMIYFEDAEKDAMPELFFKATWLEIKKYFEREVPRVLKELVKLDE